MWIPEGELCCLVAIFIVLPYILCTVSMHLKAPCSIFLMRESRAHVSLNTTFISGCEGMNGEELRQQKNKQKKQSTTT